MPNNDNGAAITEMLQGARRFFEEVAALLQTADKMMADHGWKPYSNKAKAVSETIQSASEWVPAFAFRYYILDGQTEILAFISVLLDRYDESDSNFSVPLVSAGFYRCAKGEKLGWDYGMAQWHIAIPGWTGDGTIFDKNPQELRPGDLGRCTANRMVSFAIPLTEITNQEQLEARVVKPLLKELTKAKV